MKPLRGKRVVPQKSARGTQRGVRAGAAAWRDPNRSLLRRRTGPRCVHFPRVERYDRFRLATISAGALAWHGLRAGLRAPVCELLRDRGMARRFEAPRPRGGVRLVGTGSTVPADRSSAMVRGCRATSGVSGESVGLPPDPS